MLQTPKYVAFASRSFGRNIGSPMKSETLSHRRPNRMTTSQEDASTERQPRRITNLSRRRPEKLSGRQIGLVSLAN